MVYNYGANAMSLGLGGLLTDAATQPFIGGKAVCAHGQVKTAPLAVLGAIGVT